MMPLTQDVETVIKAHRFRLKGVAQCERVRTRGGGAHYDRGSRRVSCGSAAALRDADSRSRPRDGETADASGTEGLKLLQQRSALPGDPAKHGVERFDEFLDTSFFQRVVHIREVDPSVAKGFHHAPCG